MNKALARGVWLGAALGMVLGTIRCQAVMTVRVFDQTQHYRFYDATDPTKALVTGNVDLSGVGKNSANHWATLVSPQHYLTAAHHSITSGFITFHGDNDPLGTSHAYEVDHYHVVSGTDLLLGVLKDPIPASDSINYHPILSLGSDADYVGDLLYTFGLNNTGAFDINQRVGVNELAAEGATAMPIGDVDSFFVDQSFQGDVMLFDYDGSDADPRVGDNETWLQSGDSGGPTFVPVGDTAALVGIHYLIYSGDLQGSVDTFVPHYIDDLNGFMADEGFQLTLIPEPGALLLLGMSVLLLGTRRLSRSRV